MHINFVAAFSIFQMDSSALAKQSVQRMEKFKEFHFAAFSI